MIVNYVGEFLVSPVPLELSIGRCSHGCRYCFTLLNNKSKDIKFQSILNLVKEREKRTALPAKLLSAGYPVLMSNRSDPFCSAHYKNAVKLIEFFTENDIPVTLQTKTGYGVDDVLSFLPPSFWDITINFDDEDIRKKIETNAPTNEQRFEAIRKIKDKGHNVVVGISPAYRPWCKDYRKHFETLKSIGVSGVWVEKLHFSRDMAKNLKVGHHLPEEVISHGLARKEYDPFIDDAIECAIDIGIEAFTWDNPRRSNFWDACRELYNKTYPINQDFVNACYDADLDMMPISFDMYYQMLDGLLPGNNSRGEMEGYIACVAHQVLKGSKFPTRATYKQLLSVFWKDIRISKNLTYMKCFAHIVEKMPDGKYAFVTDERGLPYITFSREGFEQTFVDVDKLKGGV